MIETLPVNDKDYEFKFIFKPNYLLLLRYMPNIKHEKVKSKSMR